MNGKSKLKARKQQAQTVQTEQPTLEEMSLKELREQFPHITARSKKEFITELEEDVQN